MQRRTPVRIGMLFMVLVIALASIGVASALWYDELYVEGVVWTGYVDVEPSLEFVDEIETKDVGYCDVYMDEFGWFIEMGNVYPFYECMIGIDVHNTGTIPVHIYRPMWQELPPDFAVAFDDSECYEDDYQLHPGEAAYCILRFVIQQEADQGAEYFFHGWIEARQYNEPR
jgi:hypothetical protein